MRYHLKERPQEEEVLLCLYLCISRPTIALGIWWVFNNFFFCFAYMTFFCFFFFFRAEPSAYEGSQARGRLRAVVTGLRHSHSNAGSKPPLGPMPQLTATSDP